MPESKAVTPHIPQELRGVTATGGRYTFDELYRMAQVCHASGLFDDVKDAAQAMVKILRGQELGMPPTTAMQAMDIIQKRVFLKPWAMAASINSCGYGGYRVVESTAQRCAIAFHRRMPGGEWVELPAVEFTIEEAQGHGLTSRSAHWKHSPGHMLYQRAMGRGAMRYFPELFAGMATAPEMPPVEDDQAQRTIDDLWGDAPTPPETVNMTTGEIVEDAAPTEVPADGDELQF